MWCPEWVNNAIPEDVGYQMKISVQVITTPHEFFKTIQVTARALGYPP